MLDSSFFFFFSFLFSPPLPFLTDLFLMEEDSLPDSNTPSLVNQMVVVATVVNMMALKIRKACVFGFAISYFGYLEDPFDIFLYFKMSTNWRNLRFLILFDYLLVLLHGLVHGYVTKYAPVLRI